MFLTFDYNNKNWDLEKSFYRINFSNFHLLNKLFRKWNFVATLRNCEFSSLINAQAQVEHQKPNFLILFELWKKKVWKVHVYDWHRNLLTQFQPYQNFIRHSIHLLFWEFSFPRRQTFTFYKYHFLPLLIISSIFFFFLSASSRRNRNFSENEIDAMCKIFLMHFCSEKKFKYFILLPITRITWIFY